MRKIQFTNPYHGTVLSIVREPCDIDGTEAFENRGWLPIDSPVVCYQGICVDRDIWIPCSIIVKHEIGNPKHITGDVESCYSSIFLRVPG